MKLKSTFFQRTRGLLAGVTFGSCALFGLSECSNSFNSDRDPNAECSSSDNCASGLICDLAPERTTTCGAQADASLARRCTVSENREGALTLIEGFDVAEFPLSVRGEGGGAQILSWSPPEGTRRVDCAHFTCRPEVVAGGIATFDRCVLAFRTFRAGEREVALSRLEAPPPVGDAEPGFDGSTRGPTSPGYVVERSVAGCWAFDGYRVIGATRLENVNLSGARGEGFIVDCAKDRGSTRACRLEGESALGVCQNGVCRRRCTSNGDCRLAAASSTNADGGPPKASECELLCLDAGEGAVATLHGCESVDESRRRTAPDGGMGADAGEDATVDGSDN